MKSFFLTWPLQHLLQGICNESCISCLAVLQLTKNLLRHPWRAPMSCQQPAACWQQRGRLRSSRTLASLQWMRESMRFYWHASNWFLLQATRGVWSCTTVLSMGDKKNYTTDQSWKFLPIYWCIPLSWSNGMQHGDDWCSPAANLRGIRAPQHWVECERKSSTAKP